MGRKIAIITACSLVIMMGFGTIMNVPAFAAVDHAEIDKDVFSINDNFIVSGTVSDSERVRVVIFVDGPGIVKQEQAQDQTDDDGRFSITLKASDYFNSHGTYTMKVVTEDQPIADATVIEIVYDGSKVTTLANFDLVLEPIGNKQIDATQRLTFTASITDPEIKETYSLSNGPRGATIDSNTGAFSWTPTNSDVGGHIFDIVVNIGPVEDRETIQVTVNQKPVEQKKEEPKKEEPKKEEPKIVEPAEPQKPKELGIAAFVDKTADPQSYVDRYNNEPEYKAWFDENFAEYDSIYQAVGLEAPVPLAVFVDATVDPQSYVDRYNNESGYKAWFDENFPEYDSIYQAVGLEDPTADSLMVVDNTAIEGQEIGECGEGTDLVDGYCLIIEQPKSGGCLIATAAYGSELAPQVQLLREIRDNQLMGTDSGTSFMTGFNQLYYSFSPTIADMERANPVFKEGVKVAITPLLSSLTIMSHAESESEVLGYGIVVILMNIGMYITAPAIVIFKAKKYIKV